MTQKYYAIVTNLGAAKIANAAALGTKLNITHMAVGDGGGTLPTPNASQTKLVNEWRRAAINTLSVDPANASQVIAEQVIPESEGGFWIREMGLFDADGTLIAVCNTPETYKPALQEGSGRTQNVRMILIVNSTDAITLKIDPSVVLATRKYVDDRVIEVKTYADGLMDAHLKYADPHPQYALKASPTFRGNPKAPTAETGNNSTQIATTEFVQAALAALAGGAPSALDTLKELADALGGDENFSTTVLNKLAGKMDISKNGTDIADISAFLKNLHLVDESNFVGRIIGQPLLITSSQVINPPAGSKFVRVRGCGGGAPGGGTPATNETSIAIASAGGAGAYAEGIFTVNFSSIVVTIGSGGAAPAPGANSGSPGGTTYFGSLMIMPGGNPGAAGTLSSSSTVFTTPAGATNLPTGGNLVSKAGECSSQAFTYDKVNFFAPDAPGGTMGTGGKTFPTGGSGLAGQGKGSGGGAAVGGLNMTAFAGGKGADGCIIVEWLA